MSRLLRQQDSPEERQLRDLWRRMGEHLARLVATADTHTGTFECPMCDGEGTVTGCSKATTWLSDELGSASIQIRGVGMGHVELQKLLGLLMKRRQSITEEQ